MQEDVIKDKLDATTNKGAPEDTIQDQHALNNGSLQSEVHGDNDTGEKQGSPKNGIETGKEFAKLSGIAAAASDKKGNSISFLMDVPLDVSVELGQTSITIRDMLQLGPGSVVELDRLIGEPVDLLVNGRLIARGEVVVFDENFGIRVTDIINPEDRIKSLR